MTYTEFSALEQIYKFAKDIKNNIEYTQEHIDELKKLYSDDDTLKNIIFNLNCHYTIKDEEFNELKILLHPVIKKLIDIQEKKLQSFKDKFEKFNSEEWVDYEW